jgi:hypothetical protein
MRRNIVGGWDWRNGWTKERIERIRRKADVEGRCNMVGAFCNMVGAFSVRKVSLS